MRATYTVDEVAEILGVSSDAVYDAINAKTISAISIGRRKVIPRSRLNEMVGVDRDADLTKGG